MNTYEFNLKLLNQKVQLFLDEIENAPWVVFYGTTSNLFEAGIDEKIIMY